MPPKKKPIPRENISAAYRDAGIEPRNIVWGWSARDEGRGAIALQVWQDERFSQVPVLSERVPLARRYLIHTAEDFESWKAERQAAGRAQDVDDSLGWQFWLEDLAFARATGAAVLIIFCEPRDFNGSKRNAQGKREIRAATYRPDLVGRVTHVNPERGEYEIALLPAD